MVWPSRQPRTFNDKPWTTNPRRITTSQPLSQVPCAARPPYYSRPMTTTSPDPAVAAPQPEQPASWTIDAARALYNIEGWGDGYFDISEKGHVVVRPDKDHPERSLDLFELASDLEAQGVTL